MDLRTASVKHSEAPSDSDFVRGQVWGRDGANVHLLYQVGARLDFTATIAAFRSVAARYPEARLKLAESAANGLAVTTTLRNEVPGIVPVTPQGPKTSRAHAVGSYCEADTVWIASISTA